MEVFTKVRPLSEDGQMGAPSDRSLGRPSIQQAGKYGHRWAQLHIDDTV